MLRSYRDLLVWQKAVELAVLIYRLTEGFPKREIYGLASQIRRAGVSVPSNIAEGYGRGSRKEYLQFLLIAQGGLAQKVIYIQIEPRHYWERGRPRPPTYLTLLLKMADKLSSRFALSAGEGARAPSNGGPCLREMTFCAKPHKAL